MEYFSHPDDQYAYWNLFEGYVTLNSITYTKIGGNLYREDTLANKVYFKNTGSNDTIEHLLYDFNLGIGDTFLSISTSMHSSKDTFIYTVNSIDSTLIKGIWYKVWHLQYRYANVSYLYFDYTIIEGIGCTSGLTHPLMPGIFEAYYSLICFYNKDSITTAPKLSGGYYLSPQSCKLSVPNTSSQNQSITIYPNPANESSIIKLPYKMQSGTLSIINAIGQVMLQKEIQHTELILLGGLPSGGLYFYRIIDNLTGKSYNGKFVYQ
jgi:hypothetical protein